LGAARADPRLELARALAALGGTRIEIGEELARAEHGMFNRRARLTAFACRADWESDSRLNWVPAEELSRFPLTTASRKLLRAIDPRLARAR
jgi:hypothetical protein